MLRLGSIFWKLYAHLTKYHMLRILPFIEPYSAALNKAVLLWS